MKRFVAIVLGVAGADQLLKAIVKVLPRNELFPTFSIGISTNTGAGFGILQGQRLLLSLVAIGVICWLAYTVWREQVERHEVVAFGLIAGGALGNVIDRVRLGHVVDFLDFSWFPSFNGADTAITIGAAILLYYWVKELAS